MKSALTIAGSDSSGGAGIQADIKTMCANHVFAISAITALTAQNTMGVTGIMDEASMVEAAKKISETFGCATLVKGGHQINDANDLLYRNDSFTWFKGKRINNSNTHGTGCTLSSAIASNLAKGFDLDISVRRAKDYISGALSAMLDLGKGSGPMDHSFAIDNEYTKEFK